MSKQESNSKSFIKGFIDFFSSPKHQKSSRPSRKQYSTGYRETYPQANPLPKESYPPQKPTSPSFAEITDALKSIDKRLSDIERRLDHAQNGKQDVDEETASLKAHELHLLTELLNNYYPYAYDEVTKPFYVFMLSLAKSRVSPTGEHYDFLEYSDDCKQYFTEKDPQPGLEKEVITPALVKKDKSGAIIETILTGYITKPE